MYSINSYKKKKKHIGNFKNICLKNIVKKFVNKKFVKVLNYLEKNFFGKKNKKKI